MRDFGFSLMLLGLIFGVTGGLRDIHNAIERGNAIHLCIESAKLGLKPAECSKLLDHRP